MKIFAKKFGGKEKMSTFAIPNGKNGSPNAEIAQLVEHNLAKVGVASSSLVFRSKIKQESAEMLTFVLKTITRRGSIICQSSLCTRSAFFFIISLPKLLNQNQLNGRGGHSGSTENPGHMDIWGDRFL